MTMVAKNSGSSNPERNAGATLFIKSTEMLEGGVPVVEPSDGETTHKVIAPKETPLECFNRQRQYTNEARISREKRLMAHLGLKGTFLELRSLNIVSLPIISTKLSRVFIKFIFRIEILLEVQCFSEIPKLLIKSLKHKPLVWCIYW